MASQPVYPAMSVASAQPVSLHPEGRLLYQNDFSIRWGDMDALGHVNNIMYFRYFEQARLEWYEQQGYTVLGAGNEGMVIVDNHAEYLKPMVYPLRIRIRMAGHSPGRSSFITTYTLSADGVLYTRGSSKVVWVDVLTGKSVPLPDTIRQSVSAVDTV
jgi:acyl-CoA thioester hydrolase